MLAHRRPLLLVAVCALLLATVAGVLLTPSAAADAEGWPWFPQPSEPTTAKTAPSMVRSASTGPTASS